MGQVYFQGYTCGKEMSAVPYISGCIFRFAVFYYLFPDGHTINTGEDLASPLHKLIL